MRAGTLQTDHIALNKFKLIVVGLPEITFITVGGITDAVTESELPDGTVASGGKTAPVEITVTVPLHHLVEVLAMDNWKREAEDPIDKGYKKTGTLVMTSGSGDEFKSYTLSGLWIRERSTPDLDMANEGEMAVNTYVMRADRVLPV